jgi:hypothetical protein
LISLLSRLSEPSDGFCVIANNTLTGTVHCPEVALRRSVSLLGRLAVPVQCPGVILNNAPAELIHAPDARLSSCITLIGRPAKPTERLCEVEGNAWTIIKHDSEHKLRPRIALLGQWPRQPHRGRVIASLMCNDSILEWPCNGCRANHSKWSHEHAEERPSL